MSNRRFRVFGFIVMFALLVAACSQPAQEQSALDEGREDEGGSILDDSATQTPDQEEESADDPGGDTGGDVTTDGQQPAPGDQQQEEQQGGDDDIHADREAAARIGSLIEVMSTEPPGGDWNTWAGVDRDTIEYVFSYDADNCGTNVINAVQQAGGNTSQGSRYYRPAPTNQQTANEETRDAINAIVEYWNTNAESFFADVPAVTELMERYNEPGRQFYGRKIEAELVDGGSYQCPEKTTSAAVEIAQELKPFVVHTNDVPGIDGSGFNMARALNSKAPASSRPMHFGSMNLSDKFYKDWAPFTWTQFVSGTAAVRAGASWICSRLRGKPAENSSQYAETEREFGLAYPNNPNARTVADELLGFIKQFCGEQIIDGNNVFEYNQDPARGASEGSDMAVQLKLNGVTSLIYLLDPITPLFHINQFAAQDYHPEYVWPSTGYTDSTTVQRLYPQGEVDKASIGITAFGQPGGFAWGPDAPFQVWNRTHPVAPNGQPCDPSTNAGMMHAPDYCRAPGGIVTWYYTVLPLVAGTLYAGPDLTPHNVTRGLQAYPESRYGRTGPTDFATTALVGAGPGQYHFITDYTEWRWRARYVQPPPSHQDGHAEYPDCMRHYNLWPDQHAKQWEPGGPNYDAWCGDAKFAPPDRTENEFGDNHEHDHDWTHEKDGYAPWQKYTGH